MQWTLNDLQVRVHSPDHHLSTHAAPKSASLFQGVHIQPDAAAKFDCVFSRWAPGAGKNNL